MSAARESILATAGRLFAARGYELVGINEIIERSGVAKATFYAQFRSKEALCVEWLRQVAAESGARYRALLDDPAPVAKKVATKFDELKSYTATCNYRGCPFTVTASMVGQDSEVREVIARYKAESRAFWQRLARGLRDERKAANQLGDALFLLYSGAVAEAQNTRSPWPVHSAKKMALELCRIPG